MAMTISIEKLYEISDWLNGTAMSVEHAIEHFDLDVEANDLEDWLSDTNIEQCPWCGWWMDAGELIDENDNVVGCDQCREKSEDDE